MLKESRSYFEEMRTKYSKPGKTFLEVDPFAIKNVIVFSTSHQTRVMTFNQVQQMHKKGIYSAKLCICYRSHLISDTNSLT